jgi:uncharacterized repeat protein (TIGR03847 family)
MALEEPVDPLWRAGRLSIGYQEERDLILLEIEELVPEEEEDDDEEADEAAEVLRELEAPEADRVRLWATREQMLSFARHGAAVCAAGRPRCRLCGNPIEPEGHVCPALNGHRGPAQT